MKIALGTDHAGFPLKEAVRKHLVAAGHDILDFGTDSDEPVDYPDHVIPAARSVRDGSSDVGVVFGGSGNGEAIAANKVTGIRCGVCWDNWSAQLTKQHNDANVIALGARAVTAEAALQIVDTWLSATFEGGRHARRIAKIEQAENC